MKSYKPYHSTGEDFLHSFMGMVGIPIDLRPEFPTEAPLVLLTEAAAHDPGIVGRIERQLRAGKNVLITSGLLRALQGKGIERIAELEVLEQRALVEEFRAGFGDPVKARKKILIPQLRYFTNDSWSLIDAVDGPMGWPLLHDADYARRAPLRLDDPRQPRRPLRAARRGPQPDPANGHAGPRRPDRRPGRGVALPVRQRHPRRGVLPGRGDGGLRRREGRPGPARPRDRRRCSRVRRSPRGRASSARPTPAGRVIKVPLKPHSFRAFRRE